MSLYTQKHHALAVVPDGPVVPDGTAGPAAAPPQRLGLSQLDGLAVSAFASGDVGQLLEQVRARAEVLSVGPEKDAARIRLVSKRLAATEAQLEILEVHLGNSLAARAWDDVRHLERLIETFTRRLVLLRREHAEDSRQARRSVVVVREAIEVREG